jgi:hypothetical protein
MDERLRFVARLLEGEKMAFSDRSHRAHRQANRLPAPIEATIVRLKQSPVLLSPDYHRLRQSLPAHLRGAADDAGEVCLHGLPIVVVTKATACTSLSRSTGLVRCMRNPASSACNRSCSRPYPVTAIAGMSSSRCSA